MQTSITELIVFDGKHKKLQQLKEVLAEPPCFTCLECTEDCDVEGCSKLTDWLGGH
jgi:hypothetical protein